MEVEMEIRIISIKTRISGIFLDRIYYIQREYYIEPIRYGSGRESTTILVSSSLSEITRAEPLAITLINLLPNRWGSQWKRGWGGVVEG